MSRSLEYNTLFLEAVQGLITDYNNRKIRLFSEADLQSHLFYWCRHLMEEKGFPTPLLLFALKSVFDKRSKVDLVLGENDVLVELKMEPDYPGVSKPVVFSTKRQAQGAGSVEEDLEKIGVYSAKGKHAHFLMIDEDGRHFRKIPGEWNRTRDQKDQPTICTNTLDPRGTEFSRSNRLF